MSDSEELSPREELLKRHRQEKKELQAKITALKKATQKDKKKKKEATEEIAKWEKELEERHKAELEKLDSSNETAAGGDSKAEEKAENNDENELTEKTGELRISKAEKRREKKAQKEKERLAEIERQEELNQFGERQKETDAIDAKLKEKSLKLATIPSDGDCLFAGVCQQLKTHKDQTSTIKELREAAVNVIRSKMDDYRPFITNSAGDMLSDAEFEAYCKKMTDTPAWGSQIEVRALSEHLRIPIEVIQSEGPSMITGDQFQGPNLILTYHRHLYGLGEHYNGTRPV